MARTEIAVTELSKFGSSAEVSYTTADATDDMYFENDGRTILIAKSGTASGQVVTVQSVPAPGSGREGDLTYTVQDDREQVLGPFAPSLWNQRGDGDRGRVHVDVAAATGLEFAAIRLPPTGG